MVIVVDLKTVAPKTLRALLHADIERSQAEERRTQAPRLKEQLRMRVDFCMAVLRGMDEWDALEVRR
ncbi:MAG: hypothetical protein AB1805_07445 [Nitrospirota bacterium]